LIEVEFLDILKDDDGILFGLIRGDIDTIGLFWIKLLECCGILLILFLINISYYFNFLNYFLVAYQSILFGATCVSIISTYFVQGIFCVLLIVPINIALFFIISNLIIILQGRAKFAHRYNIRFIDSVMYLNTIKRISICFICFIFICAIYSFVFGILLKSFVFSIY